MDNVTMIRIVAGLMFVLFVLMFGVGIFYLLTLSRTLAKCSPASRAMEPGLVWLLLLPLFNLVWNFFVVSAIAKSLATEFRVRNIPSDEAQPGQTVGIAMSVCAACCIIPIVNIVAGLVNLVLWIVYWVKISGYSSKLDVRPVMPAMPYNV